MRSPMLGLPVLGIVMVLSGHAATASAADEPVAGAGLKRMFSGKRVLITTPFGDELPVTFFADGRVAGDGTGKALGLIKPPSDTGKWWVNGAKLCQKWSSWYSGRVQCSTITQLGGNKINIKNDEGESRNARIAN